MNKRLWIVLLVALAALGCRPYKVTIEQGNLVDAQIINQLHLGMSKEEVSAKLGSPVLEDSFNEDTWIYVYTKKELNYPPKKSKTILEFKNERLHRIVR